MIAGWAKLSRDEKVKALARGKEQISDCPSCGRKVIVVSGYLTQHSDHRFWGTGNKPRQCRMELEWIGAAP